MTSFSKLRDRLSSAMFTAVDAAFLAWFRFIFGIVMCVYSVRMLATGAVTQLYVQPPFHFHYTGFEWVHPLPGMGMPAIFCLLGLAALFVALGILYRAAAIGFAIAFTYVFLIDRTYYQNHYYLVCLLSWMLVLLPAHCTLSLDALLERRVASATVPAWMLWLVRFHIGLPYLMGGIAKLDGDWLLGQPMRMTLSSRTWLPFIGPYMSTDVMVNVFVWGGLLFDLLIVPALLWKRTRLIAFAFALMFHLTNATMFTIGIFPWLMVGATLVFFSPEWPRKTLFRRKVAVTPAVSSSDWSTLPVQRKRLLLLLTVYMTFHLLWPLRYLTMGRNPSWTERGHFFAWHMLLRGKKSGLRMYIIDKESGKWSVSDLRQYLRVHQMPKLGRDPENMRQLAGHIAQDVKRKSGRDVEVRVFALVSLNGRKPELMIDPTVDLAAEPATCSVPDWILPQTEPLLRDHWNVPLLHWEHELGITMPIESPKSPHTTSKAQIKNQKARRL